ncbi:MAG: TIM barrel protein [Nitrososphaerota archaeon]|nr:TIM barrel protein [Candidatus Bathyarchaeota archaeon]MDW8048122.1 TIM barrel protein [Nitrososphaerota archaeon]
MVLVDLRDQKKVKTRDEMLKHLKSFNLEPRFSAGVWYFYPGGGRFHEAYIERGSIQDVLMKVASLYDMGVIDSSFGLEAHYPNEVNEETIDEYKALRRETGINLVTVIPNLFYEKTFEFGSLSNMNPAVRRKAIDRTIRALQMNKELNTEFCVVWPGIDGYENPIGTEFYLMWENFERGLAEAMDAVPGVRVAIEPKPYEPRGNNIYRNTANGILMARNVESLLTSEENKKILGEGHSLVCLNPEVGHILMGHEELAYALASILREGRLAHTHWNSQPLGNYDQDLNVGVLGLDQMYAALLVLKMYGYRGRFGIDINPERMPVERALVLNINALRAGCERINNLDFDRLVEAMYNPEESRGVAEDVMTRALAPSSTYLIDFGKLGI